MPNLTLLGWLSLTWGIVSVSLVLLMIYRSVVGMKEDDQIFLDPAESHFEAEQHQILAKLERIDFYAKRLGLASGGLLAAMVGLAIYNVRS